MKARYFCLFVLCLMTWEAQSQINHAAQERQRMEARQREETRRYQQACSTDDPNDYKEYLRLYPKGRYVDSVKNRIEDYKLWNIAQFADTEEGYNNYLKQSKYGFFALQAQQRLSEMEATEQQLLREETLKYQQACRTNELSDYKEYLAYYPQGYYADSVTYRIEDCKLWNIAKSHNTEEAYRRYLKQSHYKFFARQAEEELQEIENWQEWQSIKNTQSIAVLQKFILQHASSRYAADAKRLIFELNAVEYYSEGRLRDAYLEFHKGDISSLRAENKRKYQECEEYVEFQKLNSFTSYATLMEYQSMYPFSKYFKTVSNMAAIAKMNTLTTYSSNAEFDLALSLATEKATKKEISSRIKELKHQRAKQNRASVNAEKERQKHLRQSTAYSNRQYNKQERRSRRQARRERNAPVRRALIQTVSYTLLLTGVGLLYLYEY